jgi:hypothetical protein
MRALLNYDRYTERLSNNILSTITPAETDDVSRYEAAQPKLCPKCHAPVWTFLVPYRVAHDIASCQGKPAGTF